jgi:hypothetical protein
MNHALGSNTIEDHQGALEDSTGHRFFVLAVGLYNGRSPGSAVLRSCCVEGERSATEPIARATQVGYILRWSRVPPE